MNPNPNPNPNPDPESESESNPIPRIRKRGRIIGIMLLLGIITAALILWPRPQLIWCTTTPLTNGKDIVRVKLLVPRNYDTKNLFDFSGQSRDGLVQFYGMSPAETLGKLMPSSMRKQLLSEQSTIIFGFPKRPAWAKDSSIHLLRYRTDTRLRAARYIGDNPCVEVMFVTSSKADFDENHRVILNSATVLPYEVPESSK